jgi:hypothetical protein
MIVSGNETMVSAPKTDSQKDQDFDRNFKPKGAVAFFAVLIFLGLIIWFGIYFLMLSRI